MAVLALPSLISLRRFGKGKKQAGKELVFMNWVKRNAILGAAILLVVILAFLLGLRM